jgi:hypothetical protein
MPKSNNSPNALTFFLHPFAGYLDLWIEAARKCDGGAGPHKESALGSAIH